MEMTIEEAIRRIDEHNYIHRKKEPRAVYITEAFDVAISTMLKYQMIERIFKDWCEVGDDGNACAFRNLKQVICPCIGDKDGNDD